MKSLKTRLIIAIGILVAVCTSLLTVGSYVKMKTQITDGLNHEIRDVASGYDAMFSNWIQTNLAMIGSLSQGLGKGADLQNSLSMTRDAGNFLAVYQGEPNLTFTRFPDAPPTPGYDPTKRPWYQAAMAEKKAIVTSPYIGVSKPVLMITFAAPISDGTKGVVGADVELTQIVEQILKIKLAGNGYAFLLDKNGRVLAHSDQSKLKTLASEITPALALDQLPTLAEKNELSTVEINGQAHFLLLRKISGSDFYLTFVIDKSKALAPLDSLLLFSVIATLLILVLLLPLSAWMVSRMLQDLLHVRDAMTGIASGGGNLSQKINVHGDDEVAQTAQAFNQFLEQLQAMVINVRHASDSITMGATEIASGNMDLSGRTEQQASALEQTVASMDELTSAVKSNAENSREANKMASNASQVAVNGGQVVDQVVVTMQDISASSKKIVDIISVIEGIAFQTNILALNAAVEAARAGEQGRGFAVVASEVRTLAQRSASAAQEIKHLIEDSVNKVNTGSALADRAGKTMVDIVNAVQQVSQIIAEITTASNEQSDGIQQVNQALSHMDDATQQNAALVEEAAAAASSLEEQANGLKTAMAAFRTDSQVENVAKHRVPAVTRAKPKTVKQLR